MKCLDVFVLASVALVMGVPAKANVIFNLSYTTAVQNDPNFNKAGSNIQTAVNFVANEYSSAFSDNVTVNITIDESTSGLGGSNTSLQLVSGGYSGLRSALIIDSKSANDAIATNAANLPGSDPYGAGGNWFATFAEAKALGLRSPTDPTNDGTFTFNSTQSYTFDPSNRGTGGFDFIGVTEHEFSEIMGRITTIGNPSLGGFRDALDLTRFTGVGTRSVAVGATGVYFSFDNGNTNLTVFNSNSGGDLADLNGAVATDPYNAFTGSNQAHSLNSVDLKMMDVIGWDLATTTTPEPEMFAPVVLGLGAMLLGRRLRRT